MRSENRYGLFGKFIVAAALFSVPALCRAQNAEAPADCLGIDFDPGHPVTIAKIIANQPQVHFLKNGSDQASCPAAADVCQQKAYLIPGNLVLVGKTDGAYSCISYESADARKVSWTNGWLPAASMTPVMPSPAPSRSDWIGMWVHSAGHITIGNGKDGRLTIKGEGFYAAAQNVHTGVLDATAKPANGVLQFADDGTTPFTKENDDKGSCLARMQRVESLLIVEDNNACGGAMVTFTGFYRKK
jgi:hypothetical protein